MTVTDTEHWISRFILQTPWITSGAEALEPTPNASVLLPVFRQQGVWTLLMTRRALHLRHHPGQISFPGGRIESGETAASAALRETYEETGITPAQVQLLGSLPAINTSTGFIVKPWLGLLAQPPQLKLQSSEVDSVLWLPLHEALSAQRRQSERWPLRGRLQLLHFIPWQQQLIWGASAEILVRLAQQISAAPAAKLQLR